MKKLRDMACHMIWLFGYVSLGLALTLGNRPVVHNQRLQVRSRYDHRSRGSNDLPLVTNTNGAFGNNDRIDKNSDMESYRFGVESVPYDLPPDWLVYDRNPWNYDKDRVDNRRNGVYDDGVIDDFTSAVIETLYPRNDRLSGDYFDDRVDGTLKSVNDRTTVHDGTSDNALPIDNQYDFMKKRMGRDEVRGGSMTNGVLPVKNSRSTGDRGVWQNDDDARRNDDGNVRMMGKRNYGSATGRRRSAGDSRGQTNLQVQGQSSSPLSSSSGGNVGGIASQFMLRASRGNRQYDVPQIECPSSEDGMERFACPTPDRMGRYRCIDDHVLCDGFIDCPTGEDEDRQACMFYKTTKAHLDVLADALLRWVRGR
uniref:Ndl_1 protein n=1 Tax=Fopius arisanus TaxID=64838 RepID=A0A0C9RUL4_9HYME